LDVILEKDPLFYQIHGTLLIKVDPSSFEKKRGKVIEN